MLGFLAVCRSLVDCWPWRLKPDAIGDYLKLSVNAKTPAARGDEVLRHRASIPTPTFAPRSREHDRRGRQRILASALACAPERHLSQRKCLERCGRCAISGQPAGRIFRQKLQPDGSLFAVNHKLAEESRELHSARKMRLHGREIFDGGKKRVDLKAMESCRIPVRIGALIASITCSPGSRHRSDAAVHRRPTQTITLTRESKSRSSVTKSPTTGALTIGKEPHAGR